jgi:hypothetical protein
VICTRTTPSGRGYLVSVACDACHEEGPRVFAASLQYGLTRATRLARQRAAALAWIPAYHGRDWCADCARREVRS